MRWSDSPVRDADNFCREQERLLRLRPKCQVCGEYISDDYCYEIDGEYMCENCIKEIYGRSVENLMEGDI